MPSCHEQEDSRRARNCDQHYQETVTRAMFRRWSQARCLVSVYGRGFSFHEQTVGDVSPMLGRSVRRIDPQRLGDINCL